MEAQMAELTESVAIKRMTRRLSPQESPPVLQFDELVKRYRTRVYWTVRRLVVSHDEAEDITQEVFISIWQHINSFRGDSDLWAWIYRIALNATRGHLRSIRHRRPVDIAELGSLLVSDAATDASLLRNDHEAALRKAVRVLPPRQQMVFTLRYFTGLKYEEMALALGRSTGTLKANYHHAVQKMVGMLREHVDAG